MVQAFLGATLGGALLVRGGTALASESFPSEINRHLTLGCEPTCAICHEADPGLSGTATKYFVGSMLAGGLALKAPATVAPALDYVETMMLDVDADGTNDVAALRAYKDPNGLLSAPICDPNVAEVKYGCGAHVAPRADQPGQLPWAIAGLALTASLILRRRRRA
jgi:hypothetical protein